MVPTMVSLSSSKANMTFMLIIVNNFQLSLISRLGDFVAEAYQADARDFGVSVPHYSLHAFLHWRLNFEDPTAVTAILSPEPVCNHEDFIQEFVPSALEYPASSPVEIELTGDHEYDIALTDN